MVEKMCRATSAGAACFVLCASVLLTMSCVTLASDGPAAPTAFRRVRYSTCNETDGRGCRETSEDHRGADFYVELQLDSENNRRFLAGYQDKDIHNSVLQKDRSTCGGNPGDSCTQRANGGHPQCRSFEYYRCPH